MVADYFVNAHDNPDYEPEPAVITHVDEFLKLMQVLIGDKRGIQQGATQLYELMRLLAEQGYKLEEALAMTSDEESRNKLYIEYGIV